MTSAHGRDFSDGGKNDFHGPHHHVGQCMLPECLNQSQPGMATIQSWLYRWPAEPAAWDSSFPIWQIWIAISTLCVSSRLWWVLKEVLSCHQSLGSAVSSPVSMFTQNKVIYSRRRWSLICAGLCVCLCKDLSVTVHFLHSGKVTLMWAGVLSGMSLLYGTKGEALIKQNCTRLFSVACENSSTAELRKHELPLPHTHFPLDDSVTSLEPGVKETRCVITMVWRGPGWNTTAPHASAWECLGDILPLGLCGVTSIKHESFVFL